MCKGFAHGMVPQLQLLKNAIVQSIFVLLSAFKLDNQKGTRLRHPEEHKAAWCHHITAILQNRCSAFKAAQIPTQPCE